MLPPGNSPTVTRSPQSENIVIPFVALVIGIIAMGLSPIFVRLADVGPFTSAFWRVGLALPGLYGWMRISECGKAQPRKAFSPATVYAGIAFAGDLLFWHLSIVTTNVADATFFASTAPIWVVLFSWLVYRKRASRAVVVGLGLCVLGGSALLAENLQMKAGTALGDLYGLVTAVFFGLYLLAVQAAREANSAARVMFEATAVTAILLLLAALGREHRLLPHTAEGVAVLVALACICQIGGQGLLVIALGSLPATFSSLVIFLEGVAAACFAWVILGEPVRLNQAGGGLAILAGIYIARPRRDDGAQEQKNV